MVNNILKRTNITQHDIAKLLAIDQKSIHNIMKKNLDKTTCKNLEILSLILDLNIFSLIGIDNSYVKLDKKLIPMIIKKYHLNKNYVYFLKNKIKKTVIKDNLYNSKKNK